MLYTEKPYALQPKSGGKEQRVDIIQIIPMALQAFLKIATFKEFWN